MARYGVQRRPELDRDEQDYLEEKMGHDYQIRPGRVNATCTRCEKRQPKAQPYWKRRDASMADVICPKAHKPNRWRLHFRRWQAKRKRTIPVLDAAWTMARIKECEYQAKYLPQDMRYWKYHPVARRYRKLLTRWWALPAIPLAVATQSRTWGSSLTGTTSSQLSALVSRKRRKKAA